MPPETLRFAVQRFLTLPQFVVGRAKRKFKIFSPSTEDEICEVEEAQAEDVDDAVAAAQRAFPAWSALSASERAAPMFRLVQLIQRDAAELASLDAICMGK